MGREGIKFRFGRRRIIYPGFLCFQDADKTFISRCCPSRIERWIGWSPNENILYSSLYTVL